MSVNFYSSIPVGKKVFPRQRPEAISLTAYLVTAVVSSNNLQAKVHPWTNYLHKPVGASAAAVRRHFNVGASSGWVVNG